VVQADKVKGNVKCTLVQALRLCTGRTAQRWSRGIALPFHDHSTRRDEGSASRPGRSLPRGKTRYPLYRRLDGPQGRSGQVRKISPLPGFDPRTVQPVASRYTDYATTQTEKRLSINNVNCYHSSRVNNLPKKNQIQLSDGRYLLAGRRSYGPEGE
jgi:hypothetical protein